MGLKAWICRKLCLREIAAEAERLAAAREREIARLRREAARRTCPNKVVVAAAARLAELREE